MNLWFNKSDLLTPTQKRGTHQKEGGKASLVRFGFPLKNSDDGMWEAVIISTLLFYSGFERSGSKLGVDVAKCGNK
jgi:hypothetical protein